MFNFIKIILPLQISCNLCIQMGSMYSSVKDSMSFRYLFPYCEDWENILILTAAIKIPTVLS